jgi:hypothetical protein
VNQHAAAISFMTCPTENDANERRDKVDLVNWIDGCRIMWRGDDTDGEPGKDMLKRPPRAVARLLLNCGAAITLPSTSDTLGI